ncbi:hypothetical protein [Flavobacterium sp.]|uniref:hypothetical protein n=1 Tax=Flavobacterium sp. TaxID=239 RepID=UPI00374D62E6
MKNKTILIVAVLAGILLSAGICKIYFANKDRAVKNEKSKNAVVGDTKSAHEITDSRELKTKTGKTIILTETHPTGPMISTITIITKGFKDDQSIELEDIDPIEKIQLKDLDNDGFEEIYLFTRSSGSGAGGDLYVYASDKDERLLKCEKEELYKKEYLQGGLLEGFMGGNTYSFDKNMIVMEFPIYSDDDLEEIPTVETKKIFYSLNQSKLEIIKIEANGAIYVKDEEGEFTRSDEKEDNQNVISKEI